MALKIYSSREWLTEGSKILLVLTPYWGPNKEDPSDPDLGRFDPYLQKGKDIFEMTNELMNADLAIYPQEYAGHASLEHLKKISSIAKASGKKLLVFYNSDDDSLIPIDN